jgi:hypothetical protein
MRFEELCDGCNTAYPSKEHLGTLAPEGSPDRNEVPVGKRGHYLEVTQTFRCRKCGAIWENLVESGAGGHGNFWNRIDPPRT